MAEPSPLRTDRAVFPHPANRPANGAAIRAAIRAVLPAWISARALVGLALGGRPPVREPRRRSPRPGHHPAGSARWTARCTPTSPTTATPPCRTPPCGFFPLTALVGRGIGVAGVGPRIGVVVGANLAALVAATCCSTSSSAGKDTTTPSPLAGLALLPRPRRVRPRPRLRRSDVPGVCHRDHAARARSPLVGRHPARRPGRAHPPGRLRRRGADRHRGGPTFRSSSGRARLGQVAAAASPFLGTALYLAWVEDRFGDGWLPFSVQTRASLKGSFTNPISSISGALDGLIHGRTVGTGLHVVWMAVGWHSSCSAHAGCRPRTRGSAR